MHWKRTIAFLILSCGLVAGQQAAPAVAQTNVQTKAVTISGTVTRADTHLPVKNVQVIVTGGWVPALGEDESTLFRTTSVNTNDKGNFEFENLPPGSYYVLAMDTGMIMKGAGLAGMLIQVEAGQPPSLNLVLLPGSAITGRVLNEEGEPMQNVSVAAMHYSYTVAGRRLTEAKRATSDDKGEYRLFSLKPGSYLLMADTLRGSFEDGRLDIAVGTQHGAGPGKDSQKIYAATYYQNERSPEQATPILLNRATKRRPTSLWFAYRPIALAGKSQVSFPRNRQTSPRIRAVL